MTKQITFTGSTLRPRSVEEKALIKEQLHDKAWPLIESGEVKPLIYERFPLFLSYYYYYDFYLNN